MAYNGDPLFDARKLTPSPNPVESLRALPEQKIVAWRWQREDDTWSLWIDEELVSHRDSPYKKIQLAYASAPDAELFQRKYVVLANATPTEFCRWHNWCVDHPGKTMDDAIIEVLNQRAILAKHSTAAEESK